MAKSSSHLDAIPRAALSALHDLGLNLATARLRRKTSLRAWAARLGVSVSTLQRMEAGDPGVGIGVYATALWLVNMSDQLSNIAKPEADVGAITEEVEVIRKRLTKGRGA